MHAPKLITKGKIKMNIYVGNLSYDISEENLRQVFEQFGKVESVSIIKDKFSGQSKGFGFVEMPSKVEGQSAIDGLNGQEKNGRALKVNEARPAPEKRGGKRGFGGDRGKHEGRGSGRSRRF
jgi:RNA recognition motif-containing protein